MGVKGHRRLFVAGLLGGLVVVAAGVATASAAPPPNAPLAPYVVVLKDDSDVDSTAARYEHAYGAAVGLRFGSALKGFAAQLPPAAVAALAKDPRVSFVEPDVAATAAGEMVPTGVARIAAEMDDEDEMDEPSVAADRVSGQPVNVAIIDTGIDATHPDLSVAGGVNCTNDKLQATVDPAGHGTLVAGVVGARRDGNGIVGVAPDSTLWSVRVLKKNGEGSISSIICGIDWVTSTRLDGDPGNDIAVANMSLVAKGSDDGACGAQNKDALHLAICSSTTAGVTYVAAAGNAGDDLARSVPAAYDEVLTATAMTDLDGSPGGRAASKGTCVPAKETSKVADDTVIYYSNYATPADQSHTLAAPGICITSTSAGGGYAITSGTSFAAPHVTGVVASCLASGPCAGLTATDTAAKILGDTAAFTSDYPGFGFTGDPLRSQPGKSFGYLVRAGG
jgi:subtilisin